MKGNGYNVISTFSGGGGSSTGYRMAGYKVLWANEFVEAAQDTYNANKGDHTILDTRDIRNVSPESILKATGLKKGELDLFDGSPPCASFSAVGSREKGWGKVKKYSDTKQRTDDLFFEYARLLKGLQPKTFVAENVLGLIHGTAKGYFKMILRELKSCGYRVKAAALDASLLGVPQTRGRLIFVGVREDLGLDPVFPKPHRKRITVGEALKGVVNSEEELTILRTEVLSRKSSNGTPKWGKILSMIPKNPPKVIEGDKVVGPNSYFGLKRLSFMKPSQAILAGNGVGGAAGACHPVEDRRMSIPEIRRICAFPDDYILTGNLGQQWERMGRSVPPLMMREISKTVQTEILDKLRDGNT